MLEKVVLWLTVAIHFQIQKLVKARMTVRFFAISIYCNEENKIQKACSMCLRG